ncbi:hypothetical protein [Spirosoma validum]|uniref:Uncharacterized protein n=1 Tax=Spirosoma validum TaxID=2771355 RepID=A0A927B5T4_9BACT|nr:hypothetical protein [Spirosoma validum]MBD2755924.1 hypothetical protein [Spirosoma validum]
MPEPSTLYGTSPITIVVDVIGVNGVATSGQATGMVTKDSKTSLSSPGSATIVNNRPVENNAWIFDPNSDRSRLYRR